MDFTREPIIETVITPKEGCKIVVRSSKNVGQEEYFVDALEVISFGKAMFFRSLEKPKAFLVPATDYEILEVREARMVLKNVGLDRSIKIGGGREPKAAKEPQEKVETAEAEESHAGEEQTNGDARLEKKRDRRRQQRRRRGREEPIKEEVSASETLTTHETEPALANVTHNGESPIQSEAAAQSSTTNFMSALLPPPPTLISETISRYKENVLFKNAFYTKEESDNHKEEKKEGQQPLEEAVEEKNGNSAPVGESEPVISPYASFWDDINEPVMPSMPLYEKSDEETPIEPPVSEDEKEE